MSEVIISKFQKFIVLVEKQDSVLVLDTETSGLRGEILQITVAQKTGKEVLILLDTLIRPKNPIDPGSIKIHHITEQMCIDSPTWPEIRERLFDLLRGKVVITYNARFDRRAFHLSDQAWEIPKTCWKDICVWTCAMHAVSDLLCTERLRWWSLSAATTYLKIAREDLTLHTSKGDVLLTIRLVNFLLDFSKGKVTIG